jgi:hypothetical protein
MDRAQGLPPTEGKPTDTPDEAEGGAHAPAAAQEERTSSTNPPRTTSDGITSPNFGAAGSGGAELEAGPEQD